MLPFFNDTMASESRCIQICDGIISTFSTWKNGGCRIQCLNYIIYLREEVHFQLGACVCASQPTNGYEECIAFDINTQQTLSDTNAYH